MTEEDFVTKRFSLSLALGLSLYLSPGVAGAADDLFNKAKLYETEQRWSEAFSAYSEILKRDPTNAIAHYRLGAVSEKLGATESALRSYQEALRLNPGLGEARTALAGFYTNQGVAQRRNNQLDEAAQSLQQALTYNASSANAHFELGQVFEQRGQSNEAIAEYQEAIKLDPDKSAGHTRLAKAYSAQGQHEAALKEYQEVLRLNPEDPTAHHGLGVTYNELGQKEQAIASLQQAVRYYLLAGQRDKAQPAYDLQKKLMAEKSPVPSPPVKKK
jgi:tetratricopeptide (TPR) repeat protein